MDLLFFTIGFLLELRLASSPVLCVPDSIVAGRGRPALHQQAFGYQLSVKANRRSVFTES